jgi:hypothetical protein
MPRWRARISSLGLTLDEVAKAAKAFLDPVLAGDLDAAWNPATWTWGRPSRNVLPHDQSW